MPCEPRPGCCPQASAPRCPHHLPGRSWLCPQLISPRPPTIPLGYLPTLVPELEDPPHQEMQQQAPQLLQALLGDAGWKQRGGGSAGSASFTHQ